MEVIPYRVSYVGNGERLYTILSVVLSVMLGVVTRVLIETMLYILTWVGERVAGG